MKNIRKNAVSDLLRYFGMKIQGNLVVADKEIAADEEETALDHTRKKSILPESNTGG